jgi:ATP-dependent protease ClpP protease subunit
MAKKSWFSMVAMAPGAGSLRPVASGGKVARVDILGPIGGWDVSGADFLRELKNLGEVDTIDLRIHSPGGDVLDGWAIANGLRNHPARVVGRVEGMAASMGSVVLCSCDEVHIPKNGYVMIHNVGGGAFGGVDELRGVADLMEKLQGDIVDFYAARTGLENAELVEMMNAETWMNGSDAVAKGFADVLLEPVKVAACVDEAELVARFKNVPDGFLNLAEGEEGEEEESSEEEEEAEITPEEVAEIEEELAEETAPAPSVIDKFLALFKSGDFSGSSAEKSPVALLNEVRTLRSDCSALRSDLTNALRERDEAKALADGLAGDAEAMEKKVAAVLAECGFDAISAESLPVPVKGSAASPDAVDILDEMAAMPMGPKRDEFFAANEPAIMAAYSVRAKSGD